MDPHQTWLLTLGRRTRKGRKTALTPSAKMMGKMMQQAVCSSSTAIHTPLHSGKGGLWTAHGHSVQQTKCSRRRAANCTFLHGISSMKWEHYISRVWAHIACRPDRPGLVRCSKTHATALTHRAASRQRGACLQRPSRSQRGAPCHQQICLPSGKAAPPERGAWPQQPADPVDGHHKEVHHQD